MDKETLSNYGWIVICVLVLAVMIALAGPFGNFIADAVKSTSNGLFGVNQEALGAAGIDIADNELTKYSIINNPTPEVSQGDVLVLQSDADYDKFVKVTANGEEVPEKYYTVSEGSTIVTFTVEFSKDYTGTYEFVIVSNDGTAKITITIDNQGFTKPVYYGDIDMDGDIDEDDIELIKQATNELSTFTVEQQRRADLDGDAVVSNKDITWIKRMVGGTIDKFPVEDMPYYYGDVDMDGDIDEVDAQIIKDYCSDLISLTEEQLKRGDVTNDGQVKSGDYAMIRDYANGKVAFFNAGR